MLQHEGMEGRDTADVLRWRTQPRGKDGRYIAEAWMDGFIAELTDSGGNVDMSADLAGVSRNHVYRIRARDPEFRSRWNQAGAKIRQMRIPKRTRPRDLLAG